MNSCSNRPDRRAEISRAKEPCFASLLMTGWATWWSSKKTPGQIRRKYPDGVRDLVGGGTWDTIAGQLHVRHPRPGYFRLPDTLELTRQLLISKEAQ